MILTYPKYDLSIDFDEYPIYVLTIENQQLLSEIIKDIQSQILGLEGHFILSNKDKELKLSKLSELVMNPFILNINDKKIINKLYKEIDGLVKEELLEEISNENTNLISLFEKIVQTVPYNLEYSLEMNILDLFKIYDLKLVQEDLSLLDNIINYIKVIHQIMGVELIILVNIKQFLSLEEISLLYKECIYENVYILVIEGYESKQLSEEHHWIIDSNLCIIK